MAAWKVSLMVAKRAGWTAEHLAALTAANLVVLKVVKKAPKSAASKVWKTAVWMAAQLADLTAAR